MKNCFIRVTPYDSNMAKRAESKLKSLGGTWAAGRTPAVIGEGRVTRLWLTNGVIRFSDIGLTEQYNNDYAITHEAIEIPLGTEVETEE